MSRAPMFSSLRHRNARLFFFGLLVSNVGTWMQMTAMSLLVYELTGKAADVGITLLCQFLPMLLLGVWAGALADQDHGVFSPAWWYCRRVLPSGEKLTAVSVSP